MSFLHDLNGYDDVIYIKPKLLAKIPFQHFKNDLSAIEFFISLSPGLAFLKKEEALIISIHPHNAMFYTDNDWALKEYNKRFTDNTAVCNLVWFAEEWKKKNAPVVTRPRTVVEAPKNTLQSLLNQLHQDDENFDCDYFNPSFPVERKETKKQIGMAQIENLIKRKRKGDF